MINTSTTIITFLMVFLIQNTQNRDNDGLHIKIDELLRTAKRAHLALLDLDMDPAQLHALRKQCQALGEEGDKSGEGLPGAQPQEKRSGSSVPTSTASWAQLRYRIWATQIVPTWSLGHLSIWRADENSFHQRYFIGESGPVQ